MNIIKELNNMKPYICPIAEDCLFYKKPEYHSYSEKNFLEVYCHQGGEGCGLKHNFEVSERMKRLSKSLENKFKAANNGEQR